MCLLPTACDSIWLLCELQRAEIGVFFKLTLLCVAAAAPAYQCLGAVRLTLKLLTVVLATACDQPPARSPHSYFWMCKRPKQPL